MPHVLVVEDDPKVRDAILRALADRGYATSSCDAGIAGLAELTSGRPDLVLLDLGLPDLDGREVLGMLRAVSQTPVIVVTAREDERHIVEALDRGADDYMVKPFGPDQLDARIRAVLRRTGAGRRSNALTIGGLVLDPAARTAGLDGTDLDLTPREFDLLRYLAEHEGEVVPRRQLLVEVWQLAYGGAEKTVDVHVSWLRRKLGESAKQPRYIHTVRGVGVRLSPPLRD